MSNGLAIFLLMGVGVFAALSLAWWLAMLGASFGGGPFVGSRPAVVNQMLYLAKIKPGDRAADFGSGDGRIVIALARAGAEAHGYEINPLLVWWSRWQIRRAGLSQRAFIHQQSYWQTSAKPYAVITLYTIFYVMTAMETKLRRETRPGTRIICSTFTFPNWPLTKKTGPVYLYVQARADKQ